MDDIVVRAIAKWPNVPAVCGWLRLDRRGNWLIRNERITNPAITAFIGRNYACDDCGRWFFQNGPQRVFAALDYTPFVYRITDAEGGALVIETHTRLMISTIHGAWLDEDGALLLTSDVGVGVVHDGDLVRVLPQFVDVSGTALAEDVLEERMHLTREGQLTPLWLDLCGTMLRVEPLSSSTLAARFGFVATPALPAGERACS